MLYFNRVNPVSKGFLTGYAGHFFTGRLALGKPNMSMTGGSVNMCEGYTHQIDRTYQIDQIDRIYHR